MGMGRHYLDIGIMWKVLVFTVLTARVLLPSSAAEDSDFDEFDEFDEFDFDLPEEDFNDYDDEGVVEVEDENEDSEFEEEGEQADGDGFDMDNEEFEQKKAPGKTMDNIELAESTVQAKPFWQAYIMEMLVVSVMLLYLVNYFVGRTRNSNLAHSWFQNHQQLLNDNFALVGDSGEGEEPTEGEVVKESDNIFTVWSSGRVNCTGMLVHMELYRRHDLLTLLAGLFRPEHDRITVVVQLGDEDMDSFVVAVGNKRILQKMQKDYEDLSNYCQSLRPLDKSKNDQLFILSEIGDASSSFLSDRVMTFLNKHSELIESIHVSDQYTGFVQESDDSDVVVVKKPQKRIEFTYRVQSFDGGDQFLKFALHLIDHVKSIRLNREAKEKAIKNRNKVAQRLDKLQHAQRQEAAQQRREEKKKAEKEKMLQETDPDKTRKWEEREFKKQKKRMQPKAKNVKVRASA